MEERLRNLERDVAVIKSNYATKEDLRSLGEAFQKELLAQTWKIMGAATLLTGAVYVIARYVH